MAARRRPQTGNRECEVKNRLGNRHLVKPHNAVVRVAFDLASVVADVTNLMRRDVTMRDGVRMVVAIARMDMGRCDAPAEGQHWRQDDRSRRLLECAQGAAIMAASRRSRKMD